MKKTNQSFSIKKRLNSFQFAIKGLVSMFKHEHNSRIQIVATVLVIFLGFFLKISLLEWALLSFAIGLVFVSELFNSAIESVVDLISENQTKMAGRAKDYAAAGVLVAAIVSVIIGAIIFLPKIFDC